VLRLVAKSPRLETRACHHAPGRRIGRARRTLALLLSRWRICGIL